MSSVPIFAPDGTLGDVPYEHMKEALAAGGKPGVTIKSPDGKTGVVPADRYQDAAKAGASIVPLKDQETQHPGFWANVADDLKGYLHPSGFNPYPGMGQEEKAAAAGQSYEQDQARQKAGYGAPYRALAQVAQSVGVNVSGMEQSAAEGDPSGVLGHAAAPVAALGAGEALAHGGPAVAEHVGPVVSSAVDAAKDLTPKQVAQGVGATGGAVAGHGPLSPAGAYYGAKTGGRIAEAVLGKERANAPIVDRPEAPVSNVPLGPEAPPPEVLQANKGLGKGATVVPPDPSEALASIPVPAIKQAIQELGTKASVADVTARATELSKQLNDALGGRGLKPNVPLRNQLDVVTPTTPKAAQDFTPVESSAITAYKYDPAAQEFHTITKSGTQYIHGDVSPEQVQAFEDAKSKGAAWGKLKDNSTLVAKVINGKRMPVKPPTALQSVDPNDLTDILQKSLEAAQGKKAGQ